MTIPDLRKKAESGSVVAQSVLGISYLLRDGRRGRELPGGIPFSLRRL